MTEGVGYRASITDATYCRNVALKVAVAGAIALVVASAVLGFDWSHVKDHVGALSTLSVIGFTGAAVTILGLYFAHKHHTIKLAWETVAQKPEPPPETHETALPTIISKPLPKPSSQLPLVKHLNALHTYFSDKKHPRAVDEAPHPEMDVSKFMESFTQNDALTMIRFLAGTHNMGESVASETRIDLASEANDTEVRAIIKALVEKATPNAKDNNIKISSLYTVVTERNY